jgi:protein subunit release factor B
MPRTLFVWCRVDEVWRCKAELIEVKLTNERKKRKTKKKRERKTTEGNISTGNPSYVFVFDKKSKTKLIH